MSIETIWLSLPLPKMLRASCSLAFTTVATSWQCPLLMYPKVLRQYPLLSRAIPTPQPARRQSLEGSVEEWADREDEWLESEDLVWRPADLKPSWENGPIKS